MGDDAKDKLLAKVYDDATPLVQLAKLPFRYFWTKLAAVHLRLREKEQIIAAAERLVDARAASIPEEKLVEPDPRVAHRLLAEYIVASEPEHHSLREMFERLLATAMHADTRDEAHPSFVEAIRLMTPLDARVMSAAAKLEDEESGVAVRLESCASEGGIVRSYRVLDHHWAAEPDLSEPGVMASTDMLVGLGLIRVTFEHVLDAEPRYQALLKRLEPIIEGHMINVRAEGRALRITRGGVELTRRGEAFSKACVRVPTDPPGETKTDART